MLILFIILGMKNVKSCLDNLTIQNFKKVPFVKLPSFDSLSALNSNFKYFVTNLQLDNEKSIITWSCPINRPDSSRQFLTLWNWKWQYTTRHVCVYNDVHRDYIDKLVRKKKVKHFRLFSIYQVATEYKWFNVDHTGR